MKVISIFIWLAIISSLKSDAQSCNLSWGAYHTLSKENVLDKKVVQQYLDKELPVVLGNKQVTIAIDSFTFTYGKVLNPLVSITSTNGILTKEMKTILSSLKIGDVVYFETKNKTACNAKLAFKIK